MTALWLFGLGLGLNGLDDLHPAGQPGQVILSYRKKREELIHDQVVARYDTWPGSELRLSRRWHESRSERSDKLADVGELADRAADVFRRVKILPPKSDSRA